MGNPMMNPLFGGDSPKGIQSANHATRSANAAAANVDTLRLSATGNQDAFTTSTALTSSVKKGPDSYSRSALKAMINQSVADFEGGKSSLQGGTLSLLSQAPESFPEI